MSHITEISYEEYLKNLEFMSQTDRQFMACIRSQEKSDIAVEIDTKNPPADSEDDRRPVARTDQKAHD
jgi:hypothetical protein